MILVIEIRPSKLTATSRVSPEVVINAAKEIPLKLKIVQGGPPQMDALDTHKFASAFDRELTKKLNRN